MAVDGLGVRPRLLAQFVALAGHGNVQHAAAQLETTPRMLTRAVRELERAVGEPLIIDDDRSVALTPAGERLIRSARRVLEAVDRLEGLARSESATLRVAHVANADTLATVLEDVANNHRWQIEERVASEARQLQDLRLHRLDVAICTVPDGLDDELNAELLRLDPLLAVSSSAGTPQATPFPVVADLVAPIYGAAWPAHDDAVDRFSHASGRELTRTSIPTGSGRELAALRRVAHGRHILVASSTLTARDGTRSRTVYGQPHIAWHMVWRRADDSARVLDFLAGARDVALSHNWLAPVISNGGS